MSAPPALARFWWITVLRGATAVLLGFSIILAEADRPAVATFIGVYWLVGGLLTVRLALVVRWTRGSRLGLVAGVIGMVAALLVLLRNRYGSLVDPDAVLAVLGLSAALMGVLRLLGAFEIERRTGRRWTVGGLTLGTVEVVLGLTLLASDELDARSVHVAAASWAVLGGVLLLVEGLRMRQALVADAARPAAG